MISFNEIIYSSFTPVLSSSSIDISLGNHSCCITCSVAVTSDVLGCVVAMVPLTINQLFVTTLSRDVMQPHCVEVETAGNYSVAVFEWSSNGHIGSRPVEVTTVDIQSTSITMSGKLLPCTCMHSAGVKRSV